MTPNPVQNAPPQCRELGRDPAVKNGHQTEDNPGRTNLTDARTHISLSRAGHPRTKSRSENPRDTKENARDTGMTATRQRNDRNDG